MARYIPTLWYSSIKLFRMNFYALITSIIFISFIHSNNCGPLVGVIRQDVFPFTNDINAPRLDRMSIINRRTALEEMEGYAYRSKWERIKDMAETVREFGSDWRKVGKMAVVGVSEVVPRIASSISEMANQVKDKSKAVYNEVIQGVENSCMVKGIKGFINNTHEKEVKNQTEINVFNK